MRKPDKKPENPCFSSGPCPKRPGWDSSALDTALVGRSHRSPLGKARLKEAIDATRSVLGVPAEYRIGIVPGSDTGAVELALWNLLGERGVDVLAWESFGLEWVTDVVDVLWRSWTDRWLAGRKSAGTPPPAPQGRHRPDTRGHPGKSPLRSGS